MVIKNNFQRNLIMIGLDLLCSIILSTLFFILHYIYNIPIHMVLIISLLYCVFCVSEPFERSEKIFKKYCNKECCNCDMWHCGFHYKDGKYVK